MKYSLPEFEKIDKAIDYFNSSNSEDLWGFLNSDNEILKQVALLNIASVNSCLEAESIVNTLVGYASETREYCSFLINRLFKIEYNRQFFTGENILQKFALAISDVNPKVCRNIIEILPHYINISLLYPILITNSNKLIVELQEKNKKKNYQYNTKSFRLYWNIFAIGYTMNEVFAKEYNIDLIKLIKDLFTFKEYTLREKAAYLLKQLSVFGENTELVNLISEYSNDENFFVKEIFE